MQSNKAKFFDLSKYNRRRLRLIAEHTVGPIVLDAGYALSPNPYLKVDHLVGYDLREPRGDFRNYHERIKGDIEDLTGLLADRYFDSVVCGELIEHFEKPYQFLRDIRKILDDSGRLILSTPNPLSPPVILLEYLMDKRFFYEMGHKYYFLPRWLIRMLTETGYEVDRIIPVGIWFPWFVIPTPIKVLSYQLIYIARKSI